jgi:hypothetical protein
MCMNVYRTYLNVVGMGSKLLGILSWTPRWFSTGQMFKKPLLLNVLFINGNGKRTKTGDLLNQVTPGIPY